MNVTIIAALISAGAAIVVCMLNNAAVRKETEKKHESNIMLISYRLEQLEKKVDLHNNLVERTHELEVRQAQMDEKITVANHRIDDLERGDDRK